jgi:5'-nucleotidase/UDP-sugar diphosphatase
VKELREKNKNILLLDGGDSISAGKDLPELRAEISMEALGLMHYDGLNIADGELGLGENFFQKLQKKVSFPLLSANLFKNKKPLGQAYLIRKFEGFNVGVIGLVSPVYFNTKLLAKEGLKVKDPELTLREILPIVKTQADITILLAHLGKNETTLLLQKVPGVDVAIVGHDLGVLNQPEMLTKTILVQNSMNGKFLGILDLTLGTTRTIESYTGSMVGIPEDTPSDPDVLALIREFEKKKNPQPPQTEKKLPE